MSKKPEEPKLVPLTEKELGEIGGGYIDVPAPPSEELGSVNPFCAPPNSIACNPTPTPPAAQ